MIKKIEAEVEMLKHYDDILSNTDDFIKQYELPPSSREEVKKFFEKMKLSVIESILKMIDTLEYCNKGKNEFKYYINPHNGDTFCLPNIEVIINDEKINKKQDMMYM